MIAAALAGALSLTRIGFGVAYLVRPGQAGRGWIGRVARDPAAQVGMRGLGARDLALGAGALAALAARDARTARRFLVAQTLADAADVFATVAARKRLPDKGFRFALAMASGSAAVGAVSAATLRSGGD